MPVQPLQLPLWDDLHRYHFLPFCFQLFLDVRQDSYIIDNIYWVTFIVNPICQPAFSLNSFICWNCRDLEKEMATHSSILAWRIPWTKEPDGVLPMGSHGVWHGWSDLACMHAFEKEMATHSSILAWRIPGTEEPGGLPSMGSHTVRHDEAT